MTGSLKHVLMIVAFAFALAPAPANAETAIFISPASMSPADQAALSTSGDNAGFLIGLNQTLALVLTQPVGAISGGRISIFTLAPFIGNARAIIRIGSYNGGSPIIAVSRNVRAGNDRNFNNLFRRGCGILGGCDYIEIITNRTRRGADGVVIDYIEVDGVIVEVTAPTPEPSTWALMILGFAATATRMKQLSRRSRLASRTMLHSPALQAPATLKTGPL